MILNGAENGKYTGMILIDLQKVCNTSDHKILLDKKKCISFLNKAIKWFHSCLRSRSFSGVIGQCVFGSREHKLWCSSRIYILGPLLFLLYLNAILQALSDSHAILYADNTSIFFINTRMLGKLKMF